MYNKKRNIVSLTKRILNNIFVKTGYKNLVIYAFSFYAFKILAGMRKALANILKATKSKKLKASCSLNSSILTSICFSLYFRRRAAL